MTVISKTDSKGVVAALVMRKHGFWSHLIHPNPPGWTPGTKSQKRPIGEGWGLERWSEEKIREVGARYPGAGMGIAFGPDRAPGGGWLIDLEGDGEQAAESLASLFGGEEIDTPVWGSFRGDHWALTADGDRLLELLAAAGAKEGTGIKKGVWHLDEFPGLEWRIGGRKADGTIKQVQSVCPPSIGDDGRPRAWKVALRTPVAPLPEAAYAALEAIAERKAIREADEAPAGNGKASAGVKASGDSHGAYFAAALRKECDAVESASEGTRNDSLNVAAFRMGTLVGAKVGTRSEVEKALRLAAERAKLGKDETAKTIASGLDAGILEPRDLSGIGTRAKPSSNGDGHHQGGKGKDEDTPRGYICGRSDQPLSCPNNTKIWIGLNRSAGSVRYDRFRQTVLLDGRPLTDQGVIDLTMEIEADLRLPWSQEHVRAALVHLAHQDPFSSVVEWLESLQWDGIERVNEFFSDHFDAEAGEYSGECSRVFFLSAVARAFEPGCQADIMPVLIGPQGIGKSTGMAALCPDPDWFADDLGCDLFAGKAAEGLQGKWIFEFGEFARINRSTLDVVKSFITRRVDRYRPPYGRIAQDFPRACVFFGTTNNPQPLQDIENRRFFPIRVARGNVGMIAAARDQLWAEAVHRYRAGERWHTTSSHLAREISSHVETARTEDAWEVILRDKLADTERTTMLEAAQLLGLWDDRPQVVINKLDRPAQTRIGLALAALGFERKREPLPPRNYFYKREARPTLEGAS